METNKWWHIKTKKNCKNGDAVHKLGISFWLSAKSKKELMGILNKKDGLVESDLEWVTDKDIPEFDKDYNNE
tara:strand:- start:1085 stop:1300 length:216 start_codon:yes stop_codon:yes gene_type:complete